MSRRYIFSTVLVTLIVGLLIGGQTVASETTVAIIHYQKQVEWPSDMGALSGLEWSPNGQWLAAISLQGVMSIWNALDGRLVHTMRVYSGPLYSLDWNPDSMVIVTGGHDRTVRIWDALEGRELCVLTGHGRLIGGGGGGLPDGVAVAKWSPNGRVIASGGYDGTVRLWPIDTDCDLVEPIVFPIRYPIPVLGLDWSITGNQVMSVGGLDMVQFWNVEPAEIQDEISCPIVHSENDSCRFLSADWSPDSHTIMSAGETRDLAFSKIWNLETQESRELDSSCLSGSQWMPHSDALIGWCEGQIQVWDLESFEITGIAQIPQEQWEMIIRGGSGSLFAVAPDEQHIALAYQTETYTVIQIWELVHAAED